MKSFFVPAKQEGENMPISYERLSLDNINKGAVPELFEEAWKEVLDDIRNLQKPAEAARSVTIEIKIIPDKDRGMGGIQVSVKTKLAPPIPSTGYSHLALEGDSVVSYVNNPSQNVLEYGDSKSEGEQSG